ncbi:MAG TPA: hypothetical protein VGK24_16030 [Candidatus Angelobacter sp.]|jgi:hypothetical protein
MPVVLKIDPHRKVVYSAFYGRVTDEELSGHRQSIATDPDFNSNFSDIVDFSDVTDLAISESAVAAMAANPSLFSSSVVHIVVAPADVMFQLGGKFKELSRPLRPNIFVVRTRAEAYRLLPSQSKPS